MAGPLLGLVTGCSGGGPHPSPGWEWQERSWGNWALPVIPSESGRCWPPHPHPGLPTGPLPWTGRRRPLCQGPGPGSHLDLGQATSFLGLSPSILPHLPRLVGPTVGFIPSTDIAECQEERRAGVMVLLREWLGSSSSRGLEASPFLSWMGKLRPRALPTSDWGRPVFWH